MFDADALRSLTTTAIAGLSTVLGVLPVFFGKLKSKRMLIISLAFAAGIMLSVSLAELFPDGRASCAEALGKTLGTLAASAAFAVGTGISAAIERFVPEGTDRFARTGLIFALCIGLHNFPEGIATFMSGYGASPELGVYVAVAIALHNIPEGVSVALPIYCSGGGRRKAFLYTLLSGITEPIGALAAFILFRGLINGLTLGLTLAFISGIMVYIALTELIPTALSGGARYAALPLMTGMISMMLVKAL